MGKVSIVAAIAFSFIGYILLENMQQASRETDVRQGDYLSSQVARELAIKGRKLILANWIESGGTSFALPDTIYESGGNISFNPAEFSIVGDVIDFKVRGVYNGAVHDIRSRFQFATFGANPLQIKAAELDLSIDPGADLGIDAITLDDHALNELHGVLVEDLILGSSLGDFGLGFEMLQNEINQELEDAGYANLINLTLMEEADRNLYDGQNGMFFPDQVLQSINDHVIEHPSSQTIIADGGSMPSDFGLTGPSVLRVEGDLSVPAYSDVSGTGILVVEGNLIVEDNAIFNWDGLIVVSPPSDNLNPQINFIGETNLNGSLVLLQETIPNSGHMDVTTFRDYSGAWSSPFGVGKYQSFWPWWLFHTHDFSSIEGNSVVFYAPTAAERIHEDRLHLDETLQSLDANEEVFLELYNSGSHGRGILTLDIAGQPEKAHPVAAGFDPSLASVGDAYRSQNFKASELERLRIDVTRLSSLRKMWDNTETPFPDCNIWGGVMGPICVAETHYRQNALTLRLYKDNAGAPKRIYETTLYWHRREDEEEQFESEMDAYVDSLNSDNFGVDLTFGDSTSFHMDDTVLQVLSGFGGGATMGLHNLGTWHRHWQSDDPNNPYQIVKTGG